MHIYVESNLYHTNDPSENDAATLKAPSCPPSAPCQISAKTLTSSDSSSESGELLSSGNMTRTRA
jgi:hypothetical protein